MVTPVTCVRAGEATAVDRLYLAAPIDEADIALLYRLEASEREISAQRRRLHGEIVELRARLGLQPWLRYHERDGAA